MLHIGLGVAIVDDLNAVGATSPVTTTTTAAGGGIFDESFDTTFE
jgi:hypothetical protein